MATKAISRPEWIHTFRALASAKYRLLKPMTSPIGESSVAASFRITNRLPVCHNLYIECRFAHNDCRIVCQLKKSKSATCEPLFRRMTSRSGDLAIRMASSENTVYVEISRLGTMNLELPPAKQLDIVHEYGAASHSLLKWWNEHVGDFRDAMGDD